MQPFEQRTPGCIGAAARTRWASLAVTLALLLPGCAGAAPALADGGEPRFDRDFTDTTGAIRGFVTTDELIPIQGAQVAIVEIGRLVNTSEDGGFLLAQVPPGPQRVQVQALGFHSAARTIDVLADQAVTLNLQLPALPVVEPYIEVIPFQGYAICDLNAFLVAFTLTGPGCEQKRSIFNIKVNETWRYNVVEATWRTQESMHLVSDTNGNCLLGNASTDSCFWWITGRGPLRIEGAPNRTDTVQWRMTYPEGAFAWIVTVFSAGLLQPEAAHNAVCRQFRPNGPECAGFGYSLGTRFELYVSLFHHQAPSDPKTYSAMPDA